MEGQTDRDPQQATEFRSKLGCELGAVLRDDITGEAIKTENMGEKNVSSFLEPPYSSSPSLNSHSLWRLMPPTQELKELPCRSRMHDPDDQAKDPDNILPSSVRLATTKVDLEGEVIQALSQAPAPSACPPHLYVPEDQPVLYRLHFNWIHGDVVCPSPLCVFIYIFLGLLSVTTICGNLLIIISIVYFKQLHTPTNSLILSLAVADLLVGILVFPFSMAFSLSSCLHYADFFYRYYAVCHPLTYRSKINSGVVAIMIVVSWGASAIVAISLAIAELNQDKCKEKCLFDVALATTMGIVFAFYLPLIIMLCFYLKIFFVAQRQAHSIHSTSCQSKKPGATVSKTERKATKTLAIVMGVFLICWTPFFLCMTFKSVSNYAPSGPVIETLNWLALSNSMLNPFIYAFFYKWFRSAVRIIISGKIFQGDFAHFKLQ
ncbi:trace amine-associated receptor 1-like [Channa argus]|uniref:trace amine-associated receptor 1-like n=1 Tax=Channa argus TaxID=215402 RepID=UPI003520A47E